MLARVEWTVRVLRLTGGSVDGDYSVSHDMVSGGDGSVCACLC